MTLSAKWTAASFFALTAAIGAGSFAFAGCTVTSGNPDDFEGGTGTPPVVTPTPDSGTPVADAAVAKCEGNKQTGSDFFSAACQNRLNAQCCNELKTCFDLAPTTPTAADPGTDDCNAYAICIPSCKKKADGTPETDNALIIACQDDCDKGSQKNIITAYEAIVACASSKGEDVCQ